MSQVRRSHFLGYSLVIGGVDEVVEDMRASIAEGGEQRWFACMNPHSCVVAASTPRFATAIRSCTWLLPDGIGVVMGARMLGLRPSRRISGYDAFHGVMSGLDAAAGARVFFIGAKESTLAAIKTAVQERYPDVAVAGTYSPPFRDEFSAADLDAMVRVINESGANVLWVGMTAPKQEMWIAGQLHRLPTVRLAGAIGAVFDFVAGTVPAAPPLARRLGFEWLYRLAKEPRRLWRRTFVSGPKFAVAVLREWIREN